MVTVAARQDGRGHDHMRQVAMSRNLRRSQGAAAQEGLTPRAWTRPATGNDTPSDGCGDVVLASHFLAIGEFHLFALAYARWHGRAAREKDLEGLFVGYLLRRKVPIWVRHFARQVVACQRAGTLDRTAFGLAPERMAEPSSEIERAWSDVLWGCAALAAYAAWTFIIA